MSTEVIRGAAHVALLDVMGGAGIVVAPNPETDVHLDGGESLHGADWNALIRPLARANWMFVVDDWDVPCTLALLADGSRVHGLYPAAADAEDSADTELLPRLLALLAVHCQAE